MSVVTWSTRIGDPRHLAWGFSLSDSDSDDQVVGEDLRGSWGAFELWAGGVNLCAHEQQGESLKSAHWYLLPVAEWLIDNWNAVFHEQRLPLAQADTAAAASAKAEALLDLEEDRAPVGWGLPADDYNGRLEQYQQWAWRHRLSSSAPEGPLPEVWLRRAGERLEVSQGSSEEALFEGQVQWPVVRHVSVVPVGVAAKTTERALRTLLKELDERRPRGRAAAALDRLRKVTGPDMKDVQLAWLVGLRGDTFDLATLRQDLDSLGSLGMDEGQRQHVPALIATPVATLFGSLSPDVRPADVHTLFGALRAARPAPGLVTRLEELADLVPESAVRGLADGEAGGELGDRVAERLPWTGGQIAVTEFLRALGVTVSSVEFSDPTLRAVTLLHEDGRALIAVNVAYERGAGSHVVRFTLAHELAHLLYDRSWARTLAVASGPWTPRSIERRANGFAAAVLMPERLLREHVGREQDWPADAGALRRVAAGLGVGVTALAERLKNAGLITPAAIDAMLERILDPSAQG